MMYDMTLYAYLFTKHFYNKNSWI